jgi:hypothetical protein
MLETKGIPVETGVPYFWYFSLVPDMVRTDAFEWSALRFQVKGWTPLVMSRKGISDLPANEKLLFSLIVPFRTFHGVRRPGQAH